MENQSVKFLSIRFVKSEKKSSAYDSPSVRYAIYFRFWLFNIHSNIEWRLKTIQNQYSIQNQTKKFIQRIYSSKSYKVIQFLEKPNSDNNQPFPTNNNNVQLFQTFPTISTISSHYSHGHASNRFWLFIQTLKTIQFKIKPKLFIQQKWQQFVQRKYIYSIVKWIIAHCLPQPIWTNVIAFQCLEMISTTLSGGFLFSFLSY